MPLLRKTLLLQPMTRYPRPKPRNWRTKKRCLRLLRLLPVAPKLFHHHLLLPVALPSILLPHQVLSRVFRARLLLPLLLAARLWFHLRHVHLEPLVYLHHHHRLLHLGPLLVSLLPLLRRPAHPWVLVGGRRT